MDTTNLVIDQLSAQQMDIHERMCLTMLCYITFASGTKACLLTKEQIRNKLGGLFYEWQIEKAFNLLNKTI